MSSFNNSKAPHDGPSEERLREWGEAERATPPARRGRFAGVTDRLTRGTENVTAPGTSWLLRPAWLLGGASVVALSVGLAAINAPATEQTGKSLPTNAANRAASAERYVSPEIATPLVGPHDRRAWENERLRKYDGGIAARVDPVFASGATFGATTGYRESAVVPFAVTIRNDGAAFSGELTVEVYDARNSGRTYTYPVTVPRNGTFRTTLYPEATGQAYGGNYSVVLRTPSRAVTLDAGPIYTGNRDYVGYSNNPYKAFAILDERIGVLSPVLGIGSHGPVLPFHAIYAKPQNAPDRAIGYDAIEVLALGYGCENLKPAQWAAIREWVKDGGTLVMLGGSERMRRVLATDAALALSPAEQFGVIDHDGNRPRRVSRSYMSQVPDGFYEEDRDVARLFSTVVSTVARAKADAKVILLSSVQSDRSVQSNRREEATGIRRSTSRRSYPWNGREEAIGARRGLGAGCVSFYGFDPTLPEARSNSDTLVGWWADVTRYDSGVLSSRRIEAVEGNAARGYYFEVQEYARGSSGQPGDVSKNPFFTRLPDLRQVLYIFLGYFVLVVPVSFVILKQTRRLQYAWFTGPVLALTFAGGLAMYTRSLYQASQSLRTSGVLALEAGDGAARFHGVTELYVPKAGRFPIEVPGTQPLFDGPGESYSGEQQGANILRPRTANGSTEQTPTVDIPNLAFRRLYHSQTVTLGKGITATLRPDAIGNLHGTVTNDTGLTIHNVDIFVRGEKTVYRNRVTYLTAWRTTLGSLRPGTKKIWLHPSTYAKATNLGEFGFDLVSLPARIPILTATTSGESFAPKRMGRWVGGDKSVKIMVRLPAIPAGVMPEYRPSPPSPTADGPPSVSKVHVRFGEVRSGGAQGGNKR